MSGHGWTAMLLATLACHQAATQTHTQAQAPQCDPTIAADSARPASNDQPMTSAERTAIIALVRERRTAWLARDITHYRIRVAVGCFCPWSQVPRVLEVRDRQAIALFDTLGRNASPVSEPWSTQSIEATFDQVEESAMRVDVLTVRFDACTGFVAETRGEWKLGQYDDWFWSRASHLEVLP